MRKAANGPYVHRADTVKDDRFKNDIVFQCETRCVQSGGVGGRSRLYVELYIENFAADAFPCASMLGRAHGKMTLDGKTELLDDKFTRSASL